MKIIKKIILIISLISLIGQIGLFGIIQPTRAQINNLNPIATFLGENSNDRLGIRSIVADFNNDNYDDLAMGAYGYPNSALNGRVYIFYGLLDNTLSRNANSADTIITGGAAGDYFGTNLFSQDFNKDKYDDLIVIDSNYSSNKGRVYIFYGSHSGIASQTAGDANVVLTGENSGDYFGINYNFDYTYPDMGDLNGDSYIDLVISARDYPSGSRKGRAYVFYGSKSGISSGVASNANIILTGENNNSRLGFDISASGDLNNDGYDDLIVGSDGYPSWSGPGRVYIFYGSPSGITTSSVLSANSIITGENGDDWLGQSVTSWGDINSDGYDDAILSTPIYPLFSKKGRVYIFYGSPNYIKSGSASTANVILTGESSNDNFGSMTYIKDFNNDDVDDLIVRAHTYSSNGNKGRLYIFYGSKNGITSKGGSSADIIFTGENNSDYFGLAPLSFEKDINNDGWIDLIINSYGYASGGNTGRLYIYFGSKNGITARTTLQANVILTGQNSSDIFGYPLVVTKDLNNDGWLELITGAYGNDDAGSNAGKVYLFNLKPSSTSLNISSPLTYTNYGKPKISGTAKFFNSKILGVEWNLEKNQGSGWKSCDPKDISFGLSNSHDFSCTMTGSDPISTNDKGITTYNDLKEGWYASYIRSYDENLIYLPETEFYGDRFLVDTTEPSKFTINQISNIKNQNDISKVKMESGNGENDQNKDLTTLSSYDLNIKFNANSKDTELNSNNRTDQGSGIDYYRLSVYKIKNQISKIKTTNQNEKLENGNGENELIYEIENIPFAGLGTINNYYTINREDYTLTYQGFEDDNGIREGHGDEIEKLRLFDNNMITINIKKSGLVSAQPLQGENKYNVIIKAYDRAGNKTEVTKEISNFQYPRLQLPEQSDGGQVISNKMSNDQNQTNTLEITNNTGKEQVFSSVNKSQTKDKTLGLFDQYKNTSNGKPGGAIDDLKNIFKGITGPISLSIIGVILILTAIALKKGLRIRK